PARTDRCWPSTSGSGALPARSDPRGPFSATGESAAGAVDADRLGLLGRADGPERRIVRVAGVDACPEPRSGSGAVRSIHAVSEELASPPLPERSAARNISSAIIACAIKEQTTARPKRSSGRRRRPPLRFGGRQARRRRRDTPSQLRGGFTGRGRGACLPLQP